MIMFDKFEILEFIWSLVLGYWDFEQ